jgi:DNA-binding NarL/FixJ family response regulator
LAALDWSQCAVVESYLRQGKRSHFRRWLLSESDGRSHPRRERPAVDEGREVLPFLIELKEVLRLWGKGLPKKRVAAQVGLDPKTVRRYLKAATDEQKARYFREGGVLIA